MAKENKKPVSTGEKQARKGTFTKGDPRINRKGRGKGNRDWYTDFMEAVKRIKDKSSGKPISRVDVLFTILQQGLGGNTALLGRIEDRIYGKVPENININNEFDVDDEDREVVNNALSEFLKTYTVTKKK
jgi:hypothetical protein